MLNFQNTKKRTALMLPLLLFALLAAFISRPVYASEEKVYAYLYFYTIDGEEIEELEKKVRIRSDGLSKEYEFNDPNVYRYLPQEGADGELVYSEFYDQVKGIYWEEETGDGDLGQYKSGDSARFKPGEHYFRVKSDNPALTGENLIDTPNSEHAYLYFYSSDFEDIVELEKELTKEDEYTMPDPDDYVHLESSNEESGLTGKGIYWACTDENEKKYLFKAGDKCKFKQGVYEFHVVTDDPVTVKFCYPINVPTYFSTDHTPGELYAEMQAKVGETIQLKRGLGAILWGCDFEGWNEYNYEDPDELFAGGRSYRIMENADLTFYAVYEENDNWNINAVDENTGLSPDQEKEELIVDVDSVNEAAGAGYGAYIDSTGKLQRIGGTKKINNHTVLNGISGEIDSKDWLTSLKTPDADPKDPENYTQDRYGRKFEDSNLPKEINNVLKQDSSAMYMDVYGNAFVYYSDLSREDNMSIALARLREGKTDSWVKNIQNWDQEMISRFEAIEFALLKGEYPKDGEDLFAGLDPEVVNGEQLIWKSSYMSESAFKKLLPYKKIWSGWYDVYTDGLYEKYKGDTGGGITQISSNTINNLLNLFSVTAYADDKNSIGEAFQTKTHIGNSMDHKDIKYTPVYYDPNKGYSFGSYDFSLGALGINSQQKEVLTKVFEALVGHGFSEAAAAGACGNIMQESTFNPAISGGLVQWMDGRGRALKSYAASQGKTWQDVDVQIDFMIHELDSGYYNSINRILNSITPGATLATTTNVKAAADAWCAAMEGCVCYNKSGQLNKGHVETHNSHCAPILGKSYQHTEKRRSYAEQIYSAMTFIGSGGVLGGDFANMSNDEIKSLLFPKLQGSYSSLGTYYSEAEMWALTEAVPIAGTNKTVRVHKAIADSVKAAFEDLHDLGFTVQEVGGFVYRGIARNGKYLSVKDHASFHASGLAIDINWSHSPQFSGTPDINTILQKYKPATDPLAVDMSVYLVFKKNGLLWGRDFSSYYDLMHFSVGEVTQDGRNAWISQAAEGTS